MLSVAKQAQRLRTPLLVVAGLRAVLAAVAVPLAPLLYREHFVVLVLLRPTKEVLLAGGFLAKRGDVNPLVVLISAVPIAVFGVWLFYFLGRAFSDEIQTGKGLPRFADRLLPTDKIKSLCKVLDRRGRWVVLVGRMASFPSALLAAAAGTSEMRAREFLPADLAGAVISTGASVGLGYLFGEAYEEAGPWLTGVGVLLLLTLLVAVGRAVAKESD